MIRPALLEEAYMEEASSSSVQDEGKKLARFMMSVSICISNNIKWVNQLSSKPRTLLQKNIKGATSIIYVRTSKTTEDTCSALNLIKRKKKKNNSKNVLEN